MKIIIKSLKGSEETIEVKDGSVLVKELREAYEKQVGSTAVSCRLLYKGKTLNESSTLDSYGISDGDKLHAIYKSGSSGAQDLARTKFWEYLKTFLLKHFSEEDTVKIMDCMKQETRRRIYEVGLDIIEETAAANLKLIS